MYVDYLEKTSTQASQGEFWDVHWGHQKPNLFNLMETMPKRDVLAHLFEKAIPKDQAILEAGCGMGQYVAYLHKKGFTISGLDFSESTIKFVKSFFPDLDLMHGDLRAIPTAADSYGAVICLGAIEHFEEGPQPILKELKRVLKPGGRLFISVPYESSSFRLFNLFRRTHIAKIQSSPTKVFYQYRYRKNEIVTVLEKAGFEIKNISYYGGIEGLKRRWAFIRNQFKRNKKNQNGSALASHVSQPQNSGLKSTLSRFYPLIWLLETQLRPFAHMILLTASPKK